MSLWDLGTLPGGLPEALNDWRLEDSSRPLETVEDQPRTRGTSLDRADPTKMRLPVRNYLASPNSYLAYDSIRGNWQLLIVMSVG